MLVFLAHFIDYCLFCTVYTYVKPGACSNEEVMYMYLTFLVFLLNAKLSDSLSP